MLYRVHDIGYHTTIMNLPTISRYLRREIIATFSLGVVVFTLVLLMGKISKLLEMIVSNGVPLGEVAYLIGTLLPGYLVLTIPMALLLAVLVTFSRMSADNELTVIRSCGISLARLVTPVLQVALPITLITLSISLYLVPAANIEFKYQTLALAKRTIAGAIREQMFRDDLPGLVIYVDQYDEASRVMRKVMIHDSRDERRPLTIFADHGVIIPASDKQPDTRILLEQGSIHASRTDGYQVVAFSQYTLTMQDARSSSPTLSDSERTVSELLSILQQPGLEPFKRYKAATELHSRFAFPSAVIIFSLVAIPLGITRHRSGKSAGFTISIVVLLGYYLLLSFCKSIAERGVLPAGLAVWTPNLLFLACAFLLIWVRVAERPLPWSKVGGAA